MQHSLTYYKKVHDTLRPLAKVWLRTLFRLEKPVAETLPDHFLLISNHVTNFDAFIISVLTKRQMFFVATEHIFSLGLASKVITGLMAPIPRPKGGQAAGAVMEILRTLKDGGSVGLFAEGNCSWDGLSAEFASSTGKMVRASGAALVTCRIEGGYFAFPRWAYKGRKGPVGLRITGIWEPEELKKMKPADINKLIEEGIREDAYETRERKGARYPGSHLAEGLENALLVCPRCHGFDTLTSSGNRFSCRCGLEGTLDETGCLHMKDSDFKTIKDWNRWQIRYLAELPPQDLPIAKDPAMKLLKIDGHQRLQTAAGDLRMDAQTLSLGDFTVPVQDILSLDVRLRGTVSFLTRDGEYYEIKPQQKKGRYHGRKYQLLYRSLQGKNL